MKAAGHALVWAFRILPRLPFSWIASAGKAAADLMTRHGGAPVRQLRRNHERLLGRPLAAQELRDAVRSHVNGYVEQLTFGGNAQEKLAARVSVPDFDRLMELASDGPVIMALPHAGSFDRVGAWVCAHGAQVLTVAEKLDPPELFDAFVQLRTGMGMEILGVSPGDSVFSTLLERGRGRRHLLIPLLADRDISGAGIEVDFGGHRALVAAGPAALALRLNRPLVVAVASYEDEAQCPPTVRFEISDVVSLAPASASDGQKDTGAHEEKTASQRERSDVEELTQRWVDAMIPMLRPHVRDWHMMQPVFVDDLDPNRLERARKRHERERGASQS